MGRLAFGSGGRAAGSRTARHVRWRGGERAGIGGFGAPVLDLSLASTSYTVEGAPSPHSPIDTHFLCSGTHQRASEYRDLGQGLAYAQRLLKV